MYGGCDVCRVNWGGPGSEATRARRDWADRVATKATWLIHGQLRGQGGSHRQAASGGLVVEADYRGHEAVRREQLAKLCHKRAEYRWRFLQVVRSNRN
jgi:hypothetical protein